MRSSRGSHTRYCANDKARPNQSAEAWSHEFVGPPYPFAAGEGRAPVSTSSKARAKMARKANGEAGRGAKTAFNFFVDERRAAIQSALEAAGDAATWEAVSREAGARWRATPVAARAPYERRAAADLAAITAERERVRAGEASPGVVACTATFEGPPCDAALPPRKRARPACIEVSADEDEDEGEDAGSGTEGAYTAMETDGADVMMADSIGTRAQL